MKARVLLPLFGVVALGGLLFPWLAVGQPSAAPNSSLEVPTGMDCVVTVERQAWSNSAQAKPDPVSGFHPDYTLRGKIIHWGADWVVLEDGTYENWISRDKVLAVRVSR
jgi:hypothetical protein